MSKKHGPWTIQNSEVKYKNPWIEVVENVVIRPDGCSGIFGVVKMKGGVSVLPIDEQGFVYLIEEFKFALGQDSIEAVTGGIDEDEDSLLAARRELKEEAGIEADDWVHLGWLNPFTSAIDSPAELFLARGLHFGVSDPDGTETIRMVKITLEEAVQMVMESKITHGQSCVLILKAARFLKK